MSRLSKEAQSIVDEACQAEKPPADAKGRIRGGVLAAIGGGAALASTTAASSAAASVAGVSSMGAVLAKAIAVVTVVGAVGTTVVVQPWADEEPPQVAESTVVELELPVPAPEPSAPEPSAIVPPLPGLEADAVEELNVETPLDLTGESEPAAAVLNNPADPSATPRAPSIALAPADEEAPTVVPSVTQDVAEMQEIVRANQAGDYSSALAQLLEHRAQFPQSALGLERAALRVTLLCRLNRLTEADDLGQRFLSNHPESYLAERIRQQCPSLR